MRRAAHQTVSLSDNIGNLATDDAALAGPARQPDTQLPFDSDVGDTTTDYTNSEPPGEGPEDVQPALSAGNRYVNSLAESHHNLLRHVWVDERNKRSALKNTTLQKWWDMTGPLIATMPGPLLNEIMVGNISLAAKGTGPAAETLRFNKANNSKRPAIYNLTLVDQLSGKAPTPNELREMLKVMAKYPSRKYDKLASYVDTDTLIQPSKASDMGRRKYLAAGHGEISPQRTEQVEIFMKALTDRLDQLPTEDENEPMTRPLQHFSWKVESTSRIEHDLYHESSKYIMGLTEAIFRYLDGSGYLPNQYRLDEYPICFQWEPEHAIAGEILFTCIGDGYTENGGGFNHTSADENNNSTDGYDPELWGESQAEFVSQNTPYFVNIELEYKRLEQEIEERRRLRQEIQEANDLISRSEEIKSAERAERAAFKREFKVYEKRREEMRLFLAHGVLPPDAQARINASIMETMKEIEQQTRDTFQAIKEQFLTQSEETFLEEIAQHRRQRRPTVRNIRKRKEVQQSDAAREGTGGRSNNKTSAQDVTKGAEVETPRELKETETETDWYSLPLSEGDGEPTPRKGLREYGR
ncbi:uncharacterized protein BKCO1_710004 [Diplodia corticola]|uniref:Uncharacterized protein n=1 Tax=Diplodia corticola TaxID=236234 RepID=A0A1J9QMW7_9PEZI|nr:uncharacterized protein BKCO1_710004 [Diplodia corticola]OJD29817.1 hypothetical protein BKCO1_710004 [Diplodia corticola]